MISAFLLIALLGITGLVFDVGQIKVLRTQLQAGADASTLAAARELVSGLGPYASRTPAEAEAAARAVAVQYAALHRSGDLNSAYVDPNRDVNFGKATYDQATNTWTLEWGGTPANMVRVNLLRNQAGSANGDGPLPLVFGTLFQKLTADVRAYATAAVLPGYRFEIPPQSGYCCGIIPFSLDKETWDLVSGNFDSNDPLAERYELLPDNYKHHGDDTVTNVPDGKKEGDLYPYINDPLLPNAGNRGTVDIGFHGNSTQEIKDQIINGVCEVDLSAESNLYASEDEPLTLNGDTGLSAGFSSELIAIIGIPKMVPIFASTNPLNGNNADFEIVGWAPIVILAVDLTGDPAYKHIYFQPATISDECVVVDLDGEITEETSIFAKPVLIE
ncbi:MAG: hypothetical protein GTO04_08630 [Planctomycetales bacterium]|nr:hypothetical protein [Planctomycetales bacterium]